MSKCPNCGNELEDGVKFCIKCGTEVLAQSDVDPEEEETPKKRGKKGLFVILAVIAVIGILAGGIGIPMSVRTYQEKRVATQLELGNEYLMEENYGQALEAFQIAASIAPKKMEAYLGMGKAFFGMENYDTARKCMDQVFALYDNGQDGGTSDAVVSLVLDLTDYEQQQGSLSDAGALLKKASEILDSRKIVKKTEEIEQLIKEEEAIRLNTEKKYQELLQNPVTDAYKAEREAIDNYRDSVQELMDEGRYTEAVDEMDQWQKMIDAINQNGDCQMTVEQVDVSEFPNVKVYVRVEDKNTGVSINDLQEQSFHVSEKIEGQADFEQRDIIKAVQLNEEENLNICMVGDISDSMSGSRIYNAKLIMSDFLNSIQTGAGDKASLITFSNQVYTNMGFTSDIGQLNTAVSQLSTENMTAFYDALYVAVNQTAMQSGAKCVIAFTDGMDNQSQCTPEIVTELAARYNIPIFIIGIDPSVSLDIMNSIANGTGGFYRNVNEIANMSEIYEAIYRKQKEMYLLEYQTQQAEAKAAARSIEVNYIDENTVVRNEYEYVPSVYMETTISTAQMFVNDFVIYDSNSKYITAADLALLTPEQLRLARNEIYARKGRMFRDQMLQNYFLSKPWYQPTVAPEAFNEGMFNDYEKANAYFIADYERLKGYLK